MTMPIAFLFTLGKHVMSFIHTSCTLSWYFNDVKSIVLISDHTESYPWPLQSSSGSLSLTFDNNLVPNFCSGNKEQGFNISHFSINIYSNTLHLAIDIDNSDNDSCN